MPLGKSVRYRVVRRGNKKIRLAFKGKGTVIDTKNLGEEHVAPKVSAK